MTIWVLIGPDDKPFKGNGWHNVGRIKAFDNKRSANISAGQFEGVKAVEVVMPE